MRTEGQTDMTKLIVAFRNFTKAPKTKHLYKSVVSRRSQLLILYNVGALIIEQWWNIFEPHCDSFLSTKPAPSLRDA